MHRPNESVQRATIDYRDAVRLLGLSRPTVRMLVREGRIRHSKVGARVILNRSDVEAIATGDRATDG